MTTLLRLVHVQLLLLSSLSTIFKAASYPHDWLLSIQPQHVDFVAFVRATTQDAFSLECPDPSHCDYDCPGNKDQQCWLVHKDLGHPMLEITSVLDPDEERYNISLSIIPNAINSYDAATKNWNILLECPFTTHYFLNYTFCTNNNRRCHVNCWWRGSGALCEPTKDSYWGQGDSLFAHIECYLPKEGKSKKKIEK